MHDHSKAYEIVGKFLSPPNILSRFWTREIRFVPTAHYRMKVRWLRIELTFKITHTSYVKSVIRPLCNQFLHQEIIPWTWTYAVSILRTIQYLWCLSAQLQAADTLAKGKPTSCRPGPAGGWPFVDRKVTIYTKLAGGPGVHPKFVHGFVHPLPSSRERLYDL